MAASYLDLPREQVTPVTIIEDSTIQPGSLDLDTVSLDEGTTQEVSPESLDTIELTTEPNEAEQEEARRERTYKPKPQNVVMTAEVFSPMPEKKPNLDEFEVPSDFTDVVSENLELASRDDFSDTEETRNWIRLIQTSSANASFQNAFLRTLEENPDSEFVQEIVAKTGKLYGRSPTITVEKGVVVNSDKAALLALSQLGQGSLFNTPLWNTGIWITFRPPGEAELLELNRLNVADKIKFGRDGYGLTFANQSAVMADRLITLAFDHINRTNFKGDISTLRDIISCHDINAVIWGMLNTIYPNGFLYRRPCSATPGKCLHIAEGILNLSKIAFTNKRGLTDYQIAHMSRHQTGSVTLEDVEKYKFELLQAQNREISLPTDNGSTVKMVLKVPTITQYIDSGYRWINDIISMVNRVMGSDPDKDADKKERNKFIFANSNASAMRDYTHWVESITFFNSNRVISAEAIETTLTQFSRDDTLRNEFFKQVANYIDETCLTVYGVPTYECPKCGGEQTNPKSLPRNASIIPIDLYQTFFTLHVQKLQKVIDR